MANKKRDKSGYRNKLGRYRLTRHNILAIEKILRVYADAKEMKVADLKAIPDEKKHMPRKYTDRNIKIGRYQPFYVSLGLNDLGIHYPGVTWIYSADSVKFLPKSIKKSSYIQEECFPGITVTFRPFSTVVYAQTQYATGRELMIMKATVAKVEKYLSSLPKSFMNICNFR